MTTTDKTKTDVRSPNHGSAPDLVRSTLRTMAILVAACVIFVGALSVLAVAVTSRVVKPGASEARARETNDAKKPLSI